MLKMEKSVIESGEMNEWQPSQPDKLPAPTFWPIVLAVGIILFFWGFMSSIIFSGLGLFVMGIALAGWIGELNYE
jgi:hypothetical protein